MDEDWLNGLEDELAAARSAADACAAACERLLEESHERLEPAQRQRLLRAIVAPAAISRILGDLAGGSPELLVAAARVCCDSCLHAVDELEALALPLDAAPVTVEALRRSSEACSRLLDAAGA